jgi:AcrR family transcriptional regulator
VVALANKVVARLIEVGVDLVGRDGCQARSLREIARRAGVSHGAPRRHFPTHHALLAAIAREGYEHLGQLVAETVGGDEAPVRRFDNRWPELLLEVMIAAWFQLRRTAVRESMPLW